MTIFDNPNVRAILQALIPGVVAALALVQQGSEWHDALLAGVIAVVAQLAALYGTPLNKSVGLGKEALNAEGKPVA